MSNKDKAILKWYQSNVKYLTYHFLLVNGRGGFPLQEVFLGVVVVRAAGEVTESTVTFARWIVLSKVSCSALKGMPQSSGTCWSSESGLDKCRTLIIFVTWKKILVLNSLSYSLLDQGQATIILTLLSLVIFKCEMIKKYSLNLMQGAFVLLTVYTA